MRWEKKILLKSVLIWSHFKRRERKKEEEEAEETIEFLRLKDSKDGGLSPFLATCNNVWTVWIRKIVVNEERTIHIGSVVVKNIISIGLKIHRVVIFNCAQNCWPHTNYSQHIPASLAFTLNSWNLHFWYIRFCFIFWTIQVDSADNFLSHFYHIFVHHR